MKDYLYLPFFLLIILWVRYSSRPMLPPLVGVLRFLFSRANIRLKQPFIYIEGI